jgi:hypothetical protein
MSTNECDLCFEIFKTKQQLINHKNRKNKCDIITDFQCKECLKYFKRSINLKDHIARNNCRLYNKEKKTEKMNLASMNNQQNNKIKSTLDMDLSLNSKIDLLINTHNIKLNKNTIKEVLNNNKLSEIEKIDLLTVSNSKNVVANINNGNINNISGNVTNTTNNNIVINNFGNENIEYLNNDYFKDLIMNNHIETAYMKLTEDIYLHKEHPDNLNVKIDNLNNKYGFVYKDGTWKAILKYELKELLHNKNSQLLKIHYTKLKSILDNAKKNSINVFLAREYDDDPHLKDINEKMVLLFYEPKVFI